MGDGLFSFTITAFTSIFIIVDPPGNIPVFLSLTSDYDEVRRAQAGRTAALTCFGVLAVFALAGPFIMALFNISIPALRIAGGIILFTVGMQMLHGQRTRTKTSPEEEREWTGRDEVGLIPLGVPLLAGPGAITTVVVLTQTGPRYAAMPIVVASVAATATLTYLVLMQSKYLSHILGRVGINIMVRLMGLLLAAIGVQFVLDGLSGVFPGMLKNAGV